MGIQIDQHNMDTSSIRIAIIIQPLHLAGEILRRTVVRDFNLPPVCQWLEKQEQIARALTLKFGVVAQRLTLVRVRGSVSQRLIACSSRQNTAPVPADHRDVRTDQAPLPSPRCNGHRLPGYTTSVYARVSGHFFQPLAHRLV